MKEEQNKDDLNDEEIEEVQASIVTGDGSGTRVTEKEFARFIGDNAENYLPVFRGFDIDGAHNKVSWHWPAFFFGFMWMAYRRMYVWALVALFLECFIRYLAFDIIQHPIAAEASIRIVYGLIADYLYYRYAKKKILELKRHKAIFSLEKEGGVNHWADFIINKELHSRSKPRETQVQAGKYAKYIVGFLNVIVWLLIYAGFALNEEALLMGGGIFGMMLLISYYIPSSFISKSVAKEKEDSWSAFLKWFNVSAIAGLLILSYVHKLLWRIRGQ
jgi:uncharacterized membrane protein YkgB